MNREHIVQAASAMSQSFDAMMMAVASTNDENGAELKKLVHDLQKYRHRLNVQLKYITEEINILADQACDSEELESEIRVRKGIIHEYKCFLKQKRTWNLKIPCSFF